MGFLLSREFVIGLAIAGGLASLAAILGARRTGTPTCWAAHLNQLAYILMGASMLLFVIRGLTMLDRT